MGPAPRPSPPAGSPRSDCRDWFASVPPRTRRHVLVDLAHLDGVLSLAGSGDVAPATCSASSCTSC